MSSVSAGMRIDIDRNIKYFIKSGSALRHLSDFPFDSLQTCIHAFTNFPTISSKEVNVTQSARAALVESLIEKDRKFRYLFNKHRDLDQKVRNLDRSGFMTVDEEREVSKLKKLKLSSKDAMERMLQEYAEKSGRGT